MMMSTDIYVSIVGSHRCIAGSRELRRPLRVHSEHRTSPEVHTHLKLEYHREGMRTIQHFRPTVRPRRDRKGDLFRSDLSVLDFPFRKSVSFLDRGSVPIGGDLHEITARGLTVWSSPPLPSSSFPTRNRNTKMDGQVERCNEENNHEK